MRKLLSAVLITFCSIFAAAQSPQAPANAPLSSVNTKYNNGIGTGFYPTQQAVGSQAAATGLNINVGPGTTNCGSAVMVQYAGGTFPLFASSTNYIYLNTTGNSCQPAVKLSGFAITDIPIAIVVTGSGSITSITDHRTPFIIPTTATVPTSQYNIGTGMLHVTDSTGPGSVLISSGIPTNGSGSTQCPGPSSNNLDIVYLRGDVFPYQYYNCNSAGWSGPETPGWSTTEILFSAYNQLSPHNFWTNDYPYPGTFYTNNSGIVNTGNSACMDAFRAEVLGHPFTDTGDYKPFTWFNHCGVGDVLNWEGAIGWGTIGNGPQEIQGVLTAMIMYEGTPHNGKILARNATQSGTWTAFDPTSATTTGTATSGSPNMTVTSGSGIVQYAQVTDTTNPSSIAPDTYVESVSGTSVVLSQNAQANITTGDTLVFTNTSTQPFRAGYAECGTFGTATSLTFTTMPASGAVYVAWLVSGAPGTDTANISIDGGGAISISDGAAGSFATVHNTFAWWGQRFAVTGSGPHTIVISPTAGTFCPLFVVTPSPTNWNGMTQPLVVQNAMPPLGNGYGVNDAAIYNEEIAVATQSRTDGFNLVLADLWHGWPEAYGNTQYCEHLVCTYPNGLGSLTAATPHFTRVGDQFNAWTYLTAAHQVPNPAPDVVGDGVTTQTTPIGHTTQVSVTTTNLDVLNRSNTHSIGPQIVNTGASTNVGRETFGTGGGTLTPAVVQSLAEGSNPGVCRSTTSITVTTGHALIVVTDVNNAPTDGSNTYIKVLTTAAPNYVWLATNITGGTLSLNWEGGAGSGFYCGFLEASNITVTATGTSALDGSPYIINVPSSSSSPFTLPYTTTQSNDLLLTWDDNDNVPTISSGWSFVWHGTSNTSLASQISGSPGSYPATWTANLSGRNTNYFVLAIKAKNNTAQIADLDQWYDASGTKQTYVDGAAFLHTAMLIASGTQTISGCSLTTATGGAIAGSFHSGTSGTCAVTITFPTTEAAPNGWRCSATDLTTPADTVGQITPLSTTACTLSGTTVSGDIITWQAIAF